jgi:hypothetical protein
VFATRLQKIWKATEDMEVISIDDDDDEWAHLVDISDDEDDCKLFLPFVISLT